METKVIIDKKGNIIHKLISKKKSTNLQINEIIGKSKVLQNSLAQVEELNNLSEKAVYHE